MDNAINNDLKIEDFNIIEGFNITVKKSKLDNTIILNLKGKALIPPNDKYLFNYFMNIHKIILDIKLKRIKLNFENLQYLNSEFNKNLIEWMEEIIKLDREYKYIVELNIPTKWYQTKNNLYNIKNMFPNIVKLNKPSVIGIYDFYFRKDNSTSNIDDWLIRHYSNGLFFIDKIKEYILIKFKNKLDLNFLKNIQIAFDKLPQDTIINISNYQFRNDPVLEFFNFIVNCCIKYNIPIDNKQFIKIPNILLKDEYLNKIIQYEFYSSQRRAITRLLNDKNKQFEGKLIVDSLHTNFNVENTEPIITTLKDGVIFLSRHYPSFEFGDIIMFVDSQNWCSIRNCTVNKGIMCFSPTSIVNCDNIKVKEKLKFIIYKKYKHFLINLDKELVKSEKIEFIYIEEEETKKFLRNNNFPIYPELTIKESLKIYKEQKLKLDNDKEENYEITKEQTEQKKSKGKKDESYLPIDIYGKLVKLHKIKTNNSNMPDYEDIMKFFKALKKNYGEIEEDFSDFNNHLDKLLKGHPN